jgi:hypothetical protein
LGELELEHAATIPDDALQSIRPEKNDCSGRPLDLEVCIIFHPKIFLSMSVRVLLCEISHKIDTPTGITQTIYVKIHTK